MYARHLLLAPHSAPHLPASALLQGHYVPAVSYRVWAAAKRGEGKPINIRGLAIGNGLTGERQEGARCRALHASPHTWAVHPPASACCHQSWHKGDAIARLGGHDTRHGMPSAQLAA